MQFSDEPVIVVDDNDDDITLTTILLQRAGARNVPSFRRGEELTAYLESIKGKLPGRRPSAVILDVKMPGMNGLDVLEWARARPEYSCIPIIMWSTSDDPRDVQTAAERNAQCYVAKYPTVTVLKEILQEAVAYTPDSSNGRFFRVKGNLLSGREALPDLGRVHAD